jgi:DNA-binding NarL/FixJ family response regulator
MARPSLSVIIAVADPEVLKALLSILRAESDFNVVASCQDGAACNQAIRDLSPDLALVEMSLPDLSGFQLLSAIKRDQLSTRVVFLSTPSTPYEMAIALGAYGINPKETEPDLLLSGLRHVSGGRRILPFPGMPRPHGNAQRFSPADLRDILTESEREIVRLVCTGLSNKEVGRQLSLAEGTIKVHLHHIYQKVAIQNRTSLAALGARDITQAIEPKSGGR